MSTKKLFLLTILIGGSIFLGGCVNQQKETKTPVEEKTQFQNEAAAGTTPVYAMKEIREHNSKDDCWIVIEEIVHDVTDFVDQHPGGEDILKGCGQDASEMFATKHADSVREKLVEFEIGELK